MNLFNGFTPATTDGKEVIFSEFIKQSRSANVYPVILPEARQVRFSEKYRDFSTRNLIYLIVQIHMTYLRNDIKFFQFGNFLTDILAEITGMSVLPDNNLHKTQRIDFDIIYPQKTDKR